MSASHIRFGTYFFPSGDGEGLAAVLNNGFRGGGGVERSAWGWKCGGCGGALEGSALAAAELLPKFAAKHADCAPLVGHAAYCFKRQGRPCSCGKEKR